MPLKNLEPFIEKLLISREEVLKKHLENIQNRFIKALSESKLKIRYDLTESEGDLEKEYLDASLLKEILLKEGFLIESNLRELTITIPTTTPTIQSFLDSFK